MYCLLREVVKQRTPIKAGCRMKDVKKRYEGEAELILYVSPLKTHAGNRIHLKLCQKLGVKVHTSGTSVCAFLSDHASSTAD